MHQGGWIGVDLDGTLAEYHGWVHFSNIGRPIPAMVERVKRWLEDGRDVRIFTARVCDEPNRQAIIEAIELWCAEHIGRKLAITNVKDLRMIELWDDRCVQVMLNTGMTFAEVETSKRTEARVDLQQRRKGVRRELPNPLAPPLRTKKSW